MYTLLITWDKTYNGKYVICWCVLYFHMYNVCNRRGMDVIGCTVMFLEWYNDKSRPRWTRFIHPITHLPTNAQEESIPLKTQKWHVAGRYLDKQKWHQLCQKEVPNPPRPQKIWKPSNTNSVNGMVGISWVNHGFRLNENNIKFYEYMCILDPFHFSGSLQRKTIM